MLKLNNLLTFLATASLVAITGQSAAAFTLNYPSPTNQRVYQYYRTRDYYGYTWLKIPEPVERHSSEQAELLYLLNDFSQQHGGNWQFYFAQDDLNGSFDFELYRACE